MTEEKEILKKHFSKLQLLGWKAKEKKWGKEGARKRMKEIALRRWGKET